MHLLVLIRHVCFHIYGLFKFLAHLYESTKSYCCHFDIGVCVGVTLKSFTTSFFNVIGKTLSGELSCLQTSLVND